MKIIIISMIFSGGIIPNYLLVIKLGIIDSIWALVLPTAISGFYLIMTVSFIQSIPLELEESAMIDGASVYRTLFSIIIPLSKPVIAALVLFYSMYHYNSFFYPLIYLNDRSKFPIQIILRDMIISNTTMMESKGLMALSDYSQQSLQHATIIISIIPVLLVYPFIQKYFIKGVMIGAIKG